MKKNEKQRKILVTTGLPYANGSIHLGHLIENIQADIWVRFQKMCENECYFVCGSDSHGTPVMIQAEKLNISPEELVSNIQKEHIEDFSKFFVEYDQYHTTHSSENRDLSSMIYEKLKANGDIVKKTIEQAYDQEKQLFLPDRFIKGTCPRCKAENQYGDSCDVCGASYESSELINPKSVLTGTTPILKSSEHYFFKLSNYEKNIKQWFAEKSLQKEIVNKLDEWFKLGLKDWDISRDAPYFGFEIPGAPGKYFYVWLDAPIGYMASFKALCNQKLISFDEFWNKDSKAELYHFIGKDIVYFHALFWPAILFGANFRLPSGVFVHGFLTVNGQKMSKSKGTFILARDYMKYLSPECMRYYFASKLSAGIEDIDINFEDFKLKINSDLVGKIVNIASRCAGFITKSFSGKLSDRIDRPELLEIFTKAGDIISEHYESLHYSQAIREIMSLADRANQYIDEKKPWALAKDPEKSQEVQDVCTMGLNLFRILMIYLKPILPCMAKQVEEFLNIPQLLWNDKNKYLTDQKINTFSQLMMRVDQKQIDALLAHKQL